ncbi:TrmB family transcriptional regulator [Jiangella asiatica]|uniref:Helix-turn-helix transcriptional regulator n=1 Tax=Jiangella asiatica TaxID=2530372 RepID=A0A4R5CVA9_9ACTN|nr:helix-turn-helix transcriptional regulator [Jiangella asiatica]TDE01805.1 helix-turn-helix transcriptional regulator [Jiangella asiatica]
MLEELGLSPTAAAVYGFLVTTPSVSGSDVTRALELDDEAVAAALAELAGSALVSPADIGQERRWTAVPPLLTGQRLLVDRARRLFAAQQELLALAEVHERSARAGGSEHLVEVLLGEQALRAQVRRLQESASEEILALVKPPFVAVPPAEAAAGVTPRHSRVVYDRAVFDDVPDLPAVLERTGRPGDHYRVHRRVPMRLQVYDRRVATLPLMRHDAQPAALVVHASGLLAVVIELFEAVWDQAAPLPAGQEPVDGDVLATGGALGFEDRRLLGLLLCGLTDAAIAHQLGRSTRWVQRRVRVMSDAAGVRTRLQLGWEARRRWWLDGTGVTAGQPARPE